MDVKYRCFECGHTWITTTPNLEIICPYCGELGEWDKEAD